MRQSPAMSCALLVLSGCAFGPLVSSESARTVGAGRKELVAGYGQLGPVFKFDYGLKSNWDVGFQGELLSVGVRTKYAFVNNQEKGFSLAGALGIGKSIDGSHAYADVMGSYLSGAWEPYLTGRFVHVKTDPSELLDVITHVLDLRVESSEYNYAQTMLGLRYWMSEHWMLTAEASSLVALSGGSFKATPFATGTLGFRF